MHPSEDISSFLKDIIFLYVSLILCIKISAKLIVSFRRNLVLAENMLDTLQKVRF